jgi:hypothetical protein
MSQFSQQEAFQTFRQALAQSSPEAQALYTHVSEQWEHTSEEERALFSEMAVRLNYCRLLAEATEKLGLPASCFKTWDELEPDVQEEFRQRFLEGESK